MRGLKKGGGNYAKVQELEKGRYFYTALKERKKVCFRA